MRYPRSIRLLIEEFKKLPGIGEKNAQRLAFYLLGAPAERAQALASSMLRMKETVRHCERCFNLTEDQLCDICLDPGRTEGLLCVVQSPLDLMAIEATGQFRGSYHVLMGVLSPMRGVGPEDLKLSELMERVSEGNVQEVIIATNLDVEGEATASYLVTALAPLKVKITRIARGIPIGGSLEQADSLTLGLAIDGRLEL
ncbi:MAG: recombination protein RecR [bacterium]|nr:MAG: recombination protein RecR [bacterium]